ncbi:MAG: hypothetical protein GW772_07200 [Flavobacteriia bacterium]|nr:hypothetical protein [Flavobacteriia bacterium]NCT60466.1 hypothetical protein [Flavobacteriia bacterium]OIP47833.1 MAG: hypothetical protein AUK46_03320 [Flavobacteriaceae bacterium CG2_30_31_66]PIV97197.1 MAG: hypothetical protein COW43_04010 [Flavobacteriaceae bacterium CG17_big_fil_post_rev_8_21_14_2_50_31_13]PIZ12266.1 MAG: hypothetical protein COY55_00385 [Flavobacteriaceae bacterium CG_4_10_14_0_8_um_filter_31_99]
MTENEFFELFRNSYREIIESYFPRLENVKTDYPKHLQSQMGYYRSELYRIGNDLVTEIVINDKINLQEMYNINHTSDWLLNRLIITSWSHQQDLMEVYTNYCNKLNQDLN